VIAVGATRHNQVTGVALGRTWWPVAKPTTMPQALRRRERKRGRSLPACVGACAGHWRPQRHLRDGGPVGVTAKFASDQA
jgi:hypothetical protein